MHRVLVTGSRNWTDQDAVFIALQEQFGNCIQGFLVHGNCPTGADRFADDWGNLQPGIAVDRDSAKWELYGKAAGPIRNEAMVLRGADICLAFPLGISRGTRNCMLLAEKAGIPVLNLGEK